MNKRVEKKVIRRILKVAALAERGMGGEKTMAQKILAQLLKKYGLTLDQARNFGATKSYSRQSQWNDMTTRTYTAAEYARNSDRVTTWYDKNHLMRDAARDFLNDVTRCRLMWYEDHPDAEKCIRCGSDNMSGGKGHK